MLKHLTRLESLNISAHECESGPDISDQYIVVDNLPSTLKRLHLHFVSLLITDGPPTSRLSSSEAKVIQFPPELEELRLVNIHKDVGSVLQYMFPTTLVILELSKDTYWDTVYDEQLPNHELIMAALKALPRLKCLILQWPFILPQDELFTSLPSSLRCLLLTYQHLENMHKIELPPVWCQLHKLELFDQGITDEHIGTLQGCTNLEYLDLVQLDISNLL